MKTVEIKLYKFSELSEEAKDRAIEEWRNGNSFEPVPYQSEIEDTLNKFCNIFCIDYSEIDYEEPHRNNYKVLLSKNVLALSGVRLMAFLWNNYKNDLYKGKYYSVESEKRLIHPRIKSEKLNNGSYFNAYYSRIQLQNSCVLTGVCYDDDILTPIYEVLDGKRLNNDLETVLNDCIYSLCHSVSSEIEYYNTDEAIIETIEANEYDFTEDGKIY